MSKVEKVARAQLLLQLAERCEREEPSLELSVRIFLALNDPDVLVIDDSSARFPRPHRHVKARSIWNDDWLHWGDRSQVEGIARELDCPNYTTSLDAAVTLVPAAFCCGVENFCGNAARVIGPEDEFGNVPSGYSDEQSTKTPALALCAAALRAHAAEAEATTKDREGTT